MRSMTGYGNGTAPFPGGRVTIELRAVNHRFLELKMPLPRELLPYEQEFRTIIEARIKRGKLDMVFTSYGTIGWLPDLDKWASLISAFLKPGGKFIFAEYLLTTSSQLFRVAPAFIAGAGFEPATFGL